MKTRVTWMVLAMVLAMGCGGPATDVREPQGEPAPQTDEELDELLWKLVEPDPEVVIAAIDELAWIEDPKVTAGFIGCLGHPKQVVAEKAIDIIVRLAVPGSVKGIIENYPKNMEPEAIAELMKGVKSDSIPEVGEMLLEGDSDQRLIAAMVLSKSHSMVAWEAQLAALSDPQDQVKIWVMGPLGMGRKTEALDLIVELLASENVLVARAAADALKDMKSSDALEPLIGVLGHESSEVHTAVYEAIDWLLKVSDEGPRIEALGLLVKTLEMGNGKARGSAALLLARRGGAEYLDVIANHLADTDPDAARGASWAIKEIGKKAEGEGRKKVIEKLVKIIDEQSPVARVAALFILAEYSPQDAKPLVEKLLTDESPILSLAAMKVAVGSGEAIDDKVISKLLANPDTALAAWKALEKIAGPMPLSTIDRGLKSTTVEVRIDAMEYLVSSEHKSTHKKLIEMLGDESWEVGKAAIQHLGSLEDKKAIKPLIKLLGDEQLAATAGDALMKFGSVAEKHVIKALKSKNPLVVRNAARVLGTIGTWDCIKPLVKLLGHKDPDVQASAQFHLQILTCEHHGTDSEQWLKWYGQNVGGKLGFCWKELEEMTQSDGPPPH